MFRGASGRSEEKAKTHAPRGQKREDWIKDVKERKMALFSSPSFQAVFLHAGSFDKNTKNWNNFGY